MHRRRFRRRVRAAAVAGAPRAAGAAPEDADHQQQVNRPSHRDQSTAGEEEFPPFAGWNRRMSFRVVLAAFVTAALPAGEAMACKCEHPKGALEAAAGADLVFEGWPVARHATQVAFGADERGHADYFPAWSYELVVERQWKGEVRSRQLVAVEFTSCGFGLRRSERVMVYASRQEDGQYVTNRCWDPQIADTASLGEPVYETSPAWDVNAFEAATSTADWPADVPEILFEGGAGARALHAHVARDAVVVGAGVVLALVPLLRRRRGRRPAPVPRA
jgi:hypothetical protein